MRAAQVARAADRRERLLAFIRGFITEHGYAPTIREMADASGCGTTVIVARLRALETAGAIERDRGISRGIRLLDLGVLEQGAQADRDRFSLLLAALEAARRDLDQPGAPGDEDYPSRCGLASFDIAFALAIARQLAPGVAPSLLFGQNVRNSVTEGER